MSKQMKLFSAECLAELSQISSLSWQVQINDLPDQILVMIFKQLTLQELFLLRIICQKWRLLIVEIFKEKQSLKLFMNIPTQPFNAATYYQANYLTYLDSDDYQSMNFIKPSSEDDVLQCNMQKLTIQQFIEIIAKLFPNLENFVYSKEQFSFKDYEFLKIWPKLTSLTLCGLELSNGFEADFCTNINNLESLSRLNLLFKRTKNYLKPMSIRLLKPTLRKLCRLSMDLHPSPSSIITALGSNCTHLQFGKLNNRNKMFTIEHFRKAFGRTAFLTVTHLILTEINDTEIVEYIFDNFASLQYLSLTSTEHLFEQSPMQLSDLLTSAIRVPKDLRELKFLKINFHLNYDNNEEEKPLDVDGVKILKLDSFIHFPEFESDGWCKTLSSIFPYLEQLVIKHPDDDGYVKDELEDNMDLFTHLKNFKLLTSNSDFM